ncbi:MAG: hypothetical protein Q8S60_10690 [Parvibaculum sp.]|nr:hypothetical protein [Parvibaculum sp.]
MPEPEKFGVRRARIAAARTAAELRVLAREFGYDESWIRNLMLARERKKRSSGKNPTPRSFRLGPGDVNQIIRSHFRIKHRLPMKDFHVHVQRTGIGNAYVEIKRRPMKKNGIVK